MSVSGAPAAAGTGPGDRRYAWTSSRQRIGVHDAGRGAGEHGRSGTAAAARTGVRTPRAPRRAGVHTLVATDVPPPTLPMLRVRSPSLDLVSVAGVRVHRLPPPARVGGGGGRRRGLVVGSPQTARAVADGPGSLLSDRCAPGIATTGAARSPCASLRRLPLRGQKSLHARSDRVVPLVQPGADRHVRPAILSGPRRVGLPWRRVPARPLHGGARPRTWAEGDARLRVSGLTASALIRFLVLRGISPRCIPPHGHLVRVADTQRPAEGLPPSSQRSKWRFGDSLAFSVT